MATDYYPRETIFKLMKDGEWADVVDEVCRHKVFNIKNDPMAVYVISTMKEEFLRYLDTLPANEKVAKLRTITLEVSHTPGIFQFDFENEIIARKLNALWESDKEGLVYYANTYVNINIKELEPAKELARQLLLKIREHSPSSLAKSRNQGIQIKLEGESTTNEKISICQSLFRSPQEKMFYHSLASLFPEDIVQANCAIHTALAWEAVKEKLTSDERSFFFKGLFDFVVFSGEKALPQMFFELDSSYHNTTQARENDLLKDSIAQKCSIKLFRIKPLEENLRNEKTFTKLIIDLTANYRNHSAKHL